MDIDFSFHSNIFNPLNIIIWSIKTFIVFVWNFYSCIHLSWLDLVIHGLYIKWPNPYTPKSLVMFFLGKDWSKALFPQVTSMHLSSSQWLFFTIALFFSFLKVVLKGLKQLTSNGCKAWEVWDGKVTMSNPNSYIYYKSVSNATCDPCPSKNNRWWFYFVMPLGTNLLKKDGNFLNKTKSSCFPLHHHACSCSTMFDIIVFNLFTLEYVKP